VSWANHPRWSRWAVHFLESKISSGVTWRPNRQESNEIKPQRISGFNLGAFFDGELWTWWTPPCLSHEIISLCIQDVSKMYPRCIQATNISGSVLWCMVSKVVCPWECPTPRTPSVTLGAQANRACLWRGWSLDEWAPAFEKPPADAISPIGALKTEARNAENWLLLQIFKLCQIKWVKRRRQHTFQLTTQMPAQNTSWNTTWNTVSLDPTKQPTPWRLPRLCNPRLVNVEVVFDQAFRLQGSTGAK